MSFEGVAERMKSRRKPTRGERLQALWTGEAPEPPPLPEPIAPVAPAKRTWALVGAYALLAAGVLVALVGAIPLVLFFGATSHWQHRGLFVVVAIGVSLVVKSTRLFERVARTEPLPTARLT